MLIPTPSHVQKVPRHPLNKGRPGSRVTFFPSRKAGHPIACGSLIQADLCVHFEYSRNVKTYECRPAIVRFNDISFKADFLVTLNSGSVSYLKLLPGEVTSEESDTESRQKIELRLLDDGVKIVWLKPAELPSPLLTSNLRALYYYSFGSNQQAVRHVCKYVLGLKEQCATVETLLTSGACTQDIYQAIFSGALYVRLDQKLSPQTMVYGRSV
ncbi:MULTISPECIES: hypothetical protein [Pseudomonas]|uniref:TnsA endonuclease N-terminal domain-containing protein n=1 Tax=Pseudomonas putida TaxID=303 RepID=A0A7V8EHK9_PSEPU|nr:MULTISPECIES: hypothetical protein [Pseudomonas]KAF0254739.1 hypothetical protein GN299_10945 [Pseudomonas putida]MDS9593429.1 hypothetical protein [Pseudomonas sp. HTZ1]